MMKRMLQKAVGGYLRLRPKVQMKGADGLIAEADDLWRVEEVDDKAVTLHNEQLNIRHALGVDNVRSFQSPDFLLLRCDLTIDVDRVRTEPHIQGRVPKPPPEQVLERAVKDALPRIPGAWEWSDQLLKDPSRLRGWLASATRDENGADLDRYGFLRPLPKRGLP